MRMRRLRQRKPRWAERADLRANAWVNDRHLWHRADVALRRLSRAADRSRLWFGAACVLFSLGRRRAAIRGVASLAVASLVANVLGKRLFGGTRPHAAATPLRRRLRKYPVSASFPSGHAASAAAFATGVALEDRAAGATVAPVAVAVAYSRVHVGAHWASDVVGGVALGAAVARLGAAVVPPAPAMPPYARVPLQPRPRGRGIVIAANPDAGSGVLRPDPRRAIDQRLPEATVDEMRDDRGIDEIVADALAHGRPGVLGTLGGDGSVAAMAHHARRLRLPLLVLAGGTFNHFAKAVGVARVWRSLGGALVGSAARVAVAEVEAGRLAPRTVLNTLSIGVYPDFVACRERLEPYVGTWIGAVVAAARAVRRADPIDVAVDGRPARIWSAFVEVRRGVGPAGSRPTTADGILDIRIFHARGGRLRAFGALVLGRLSAVAGRPGIQHLQASSLTLDVGTQDGRVVPFAHDGELVEAPAAGDYRLTLAIAEDALEVIVPRR